MTLEGSSRAVRRALAQRLRRAFAEQDLAKDRPSRGYEPEQHSGSRVGHESQDRERESFSRQQYERDHPHGHRPKPTDAKGAATQHTAEQKGRGEGYWDGRSSRDHHSGYAGERRPD